MDEVKRLHDAVKGIAEFVGGQTLGEDLGWFRLIDEPTGAEPGAWPKRLHVWEIGIATLAGRDEQDRIRPITRDALEKRYQKEEP